MKLSEKIVSAQDDIKQSRDAISEILAKSESEERDLDDEEQALIDEHSETIETAQKNIGTWEKAERALARTAVAREDAKKATTRFAAAKKELPGDIIVKMATLSLLEHVRKTDIGVLQREHYGDDARMEAVVKSVVNPADTVTVGWAAELVSEGIAGFMEELRGASVYAQLASMGIGIEFGMNGSVSVPGWGGGPDDLAGSFVAEGAPIPVKRSTVVSSTLNRYKMAVISTFTKELSRASTPQIEGLIRRKIIDDTGQAIDVALLDPAGVAVAGVKPASITNGAPNQPATGTGSAADVLADLTWLIGQLTAANAGRMPVLIMHPNHVLGLSTKINATGQFLFRGDIQNGNLLGATLVTSTNVPTDIVIAMDAADFATAFGMPEFDASDVATIVEANDDGTAPEVTTVGAAATAGAPPIRSLFQTFSTGLRMVMPISWARIRPNTLAYITGVAW